MGLDPGESKRAGEALLSPIFRAPDEPEPPELSEEAAAALRSASGEEDLPEDARRQFAAFKAQREAWEAERDALDAQRERLSQAMKRIDREGGTLADLPQGMLDLLVKAEAAMPKKPDAPGS